MYQFFVFLHFLLHKIDILLHFYKYTNIQIYKYTNIQIIKFSMMNGFTNDLLHRPERKMRQKCNKNILLNFI
jgi:hypothetical protein